MNGRGVVTSLTPDQHPGSLVLLHATGQRLIRLLRPEGVAADRDEQCRGAPAEGLVRQAPDHGVARHTLTAAVLAPALVAVRRRDDPAGQDRRAGRARGVAR